jgi:hypothetical protein
MVAEHVLDDERVLDAVWFEFEFEGGAGIGVRGDAIGWGLAVETERPVPKDLDPYGHVEVTVATLRARPITGAVVESSACARSTTTSRTGSS